MRESVVEKKFAAEVKKRGGLAVKFVSPGFNGVPDRLVLFPGGRMAFVELKAPGETMRPCAKKRWNVWTGLVQTTVSRALIPDAFCGCGETGRRFCGAS